MIRKKNRKKRISGAATAQMQPPKNWELLLYLFRSTTDCDSVIGDLEERYRTVATRLGPIRAAIWYRKQVLASLWPLAKATIKRTSSAAVIHIVAVGLRIVWLGGAADVLKQSLVDGLKKRDDEAKRRSV